MNRIIVIPNRLIWIDWAKALAITFVVFGHIPEEKGSFLINYIVQFHMPLFFFISGFLTKKEYFGKTTLTKYWHTLIIPYLCFNFIYYPYWVVKHIIEHPDAGWYEFIKPIIGTFMLQHETPYYESLNGVTWFISSLLIMKILLSISNKYHCKAALTIIVILDAFLYIINEHYRLVTDLPFVGFIRCLPFFMLGHLCKQKNIVKDKPQHKDLILCIGGIFISTITYAILRELDGIFSYGICFWIICISAITGFLSLCKLLNRFHSIIIDNISIGTIVIMGLHWILIGITNYSLIKILHIEGGIVYPLPIAISLALLFVIILYPIIILFKNKFPFMLGKWKPLPPNFISKELNPSD